MHKNSASVKKLYSITIMGAVINVLLGIGKISAGFFGKSKALIADGFHSISDLLSDVVVIIGLKLSSHPPDETHHYGHAKIENFSELLIGILLAVTAFIIVFDAGKAIYLHKEIKPSGFTVIIALISIIVKEVLFRITLNAGKKFNNSAIIANAWHHRSDSFSSIAVLIGLTAAHFYEPLHILDAYMGLLVSFIILKVSIAAIINSVKKLVDASPDEVIYENIKKIISSDKNIVDFHKLRMRYIGNELIIEMHIHVEPDLTIKEAHDISENLKANIIKLTPNIYDVTIHIEPAIQKQDNN